jgi:hypothetical protein
MSFAARLTHLGYSVHWVLNIKAGFVPFYAIRLSCLNKQLLLIDKISKMVIGTA